MLERREQIHQPANFEATAEGNNDTAGIERIAQTEILPDLIKVGQLKADGVDRSDPQILDLDRKSREEVRHILEEAEGTLVGERYRRFRTLLDDYVAAKSDLGQLRAFVAEEFKPGFGNRDQFVHDIESDGPGLMLANHNTHTIEIDDVDDQGRIVNDLGPVITRIGMDHALEGTDVSVTRLVKSPNPSHFYLRVMEELGNEQLSDDGVDEIAKQLELITGNGTVPVISPEGGFRALGKWSTGPIVLAAKAGIDNLKLVAHSPMVSLLAPRLSFDYIGQQKIPQEVQDAVAAGDRAAIRNYSDEIRNQFAIAIQRLPYPKAYKDAVIQYVRM